MNVPARIGGTSFICQNRWLPQIERLVDWFDDSEILLFEHEGGILDEAERCTFRQKLGRC